MKLPFLQVEFFLSPATPNQRGLWADHDAKQWIAIGLGWRVLTLARLPDPKR